MNFAISLVGIFLVLLSVCNGVVFDWGKDSITENSSVQPEQHEKYNNSFIEAIVEEKIRLLASKVTHGLYEQRQKDRHRDRQISSLSAQFNAIKSDLKNEKLLSRKRQDVIHALRRQVESQKLELGRSQGDIMELRALFRELAGKPSWLTPTKKPEITVNTTPRPVAIKGYPRDCSDVFDEGGMRFPGNYYIMIEPLTSKRPFKVACKMDTKSGWTVIQRRKDGTVDFYRSWDDYKQGFGNLEGEFWLGNDRIHKITTQGGNYKLRIEMEDFNGKQYYAEYDSFKIDGEDKKYTLRVSGYHGDAGDSMTSRWSNHDSIPFSTYDSDNDRRGYDNCAKHFHGAWWFKDCFQSHLNGMYYQKGSHNNYFQRNGVQWNTIHLHSSLKTVSMMIKPYDVNIPNLV